MSQSLRKDLTGKRSGILTAIRYIGPIGNSSLWLCRCDCGKEKKVRVSNFGKTQSCGCLRRQQMSERQTTHGATKNGVRLPEYDVWATMKARCYNPNNKHFNRYGGRGITVCDRWLIGENDLTGFECFLLDMKRRPNPDLQIDRFPNNNGNYEPTNCRWATVTQQQRNRSSNHLISYAGKSVSLTEAAEAAGINASTVFGRINLGWSEEEALSNPLTWRGQKIRKGARIRLFQPVRGD